MKKCMICHCWYFLYCKCKYEQEVCDGCQDISMMAYELENIAILNISGVDYRCVIWGMSRSDTINKLNNDVSINKYGVSVEHH